MVDHLTNSQKGEIMPDDIISEDDIADVSLLDNAPADATQAGSGDSTEQGKDDAVDTSKTDEKLDDKGDAKGTEAKDAEGAADEAKSGDDTAAQDEDAAGTKDESREDQRLRAQREYQNRQRTKQTVEQQMDTTFGPKTEQELIDEGLPESDAKFEALRQEIAYSNQRTAIAELNSGMQSDAVNAMHDFPIFDPNSKEFDEGFTNMVQQQYWTAARVQTAQVVDPRTGQPSDIVTNAEVPLYDFYQQMAQIYSRGTSKGAEQGQAEMQQMLSRTENPGGSSSAGAATGSLEELEERLGDVVIT